MAIEIVMPKLGWTMEEGVLAEWLKKDGDTVKPGDILFTVESDKALQEIEAFDGGILRIPPDSPPPGSTVKVGGLLAYLVQPGEKAPFETGAAQPASAQPAAIAPRMTKPEIRPPLEKPNGKSTPAISPRARRVAGELGVDWTALQGSGRTGRIVERDVRAAAEAQPALPAAQISPVAQRAAKELGVDLTELAARLPGQRITREDVERFAAELAAPIAQPPIGETRAPIPHIRTLIARRMANSAHTTAPVTLTTEADATELVRLRKQLKGDVSAATQPVPTYNDLLAKLVAAALVEHPMLNARFEGSEIVLSASVHIGLAVDTERGLLLPVIRDVQAKTVRQIAQEFARLIEQARAGTIRAEDMQGGTFSISNLGMYDIDAFTPIINLPECAILGVGRIMPKQIVIDAETERVAIRHMMFLSLTFDHRLVDGAPAARFLQRVKQFVEQPYLWLAG
jgi:pyruvate dehydrogenase E2 component (dihydrolipoamide acetyltransferase)